VVLICGPPCGGKSTTAERLATGPADWVVDFDVVARELGSPVRWLHPEPYRTHAEQQVVQLLARLPGGGEGTAYVIRSLPRPEQRAIAARISNAAATLVLDPGEDECLRRATVDGRPEGTAEQIRSWYARYRPWSGDTTVIH
jgi:predicted kinase